MWITKNQNQDVPLICNDRGIFNLSDCMDIYKDVSTSDELVDLELCETISDNDFMRISSPRKYLVYYKGVVMLEYQFIKPIIVLCTNKKAFIVDDNIYKSQINKFKIKLRKKGYEIIEVNESQLNNLFFNPLNVTMDDYNPNQQAVVMEQVIKEVVG